MPRRHRLFMNSPSHSLPDPVRLWIFRILVPLGGHRELCGTNSFRNDTIVELVGLGQYVDGAGADYDQRDALRELRQLHAEAESQSARCVMPAQLRENVDRLAGLIGLSPVDCRILEFAALIHNERHLDDAADLLGLLSSIKVFQVLAVLLDVPERDIARALAPNGALAHAGLVTLDRHSMQSLRGKLDLISGTFADLLLSGDTEPMQLLRDVVLPVPAPSLAMEDFAHIADWLAILVPYLRHALATRRPGVNVFIHGAPGTGKTELARLLAQTLGAELLEVANSDSDGDAVIGERRLRNLRAAQSIFAHRSSLLLFDEAQDVFDDGSSGLFGRPSTAQVRKSWINHALEETPVPTIWLSNSVDCLDKAFVRRFDLIFELPTPPQRQRERIVAEACAGILPATTVRRIARNEAAAPAVIARAAAVAGAIRNDLTDRLPEVVEKLVNATLAAQGVGRGVGSFEELPALYSPGYLNVGVNLEAMAAGIASARSARLCLYGPPGTGKTAYARWLADRLAVPLQIRRGSDLFGQYVGQTEKNIARCFREAHNDGALLLIDEADSFLRDRQSATRSWEVSAVNEMLTQIESYAGVFVASTNLLGEIDAAALRRFDFKLEFGYLKEDQAVSLVREYAAAMGLPEPSEDERRRIARVRSLTPGDFAAVARRHRFAPLRTVSALLGALEGECALKKGVRVQTMGFA